MLISPVSFMGTHRRRRPQNINSQQQNSENPKKENNYEYAFSQTGRYVTPIEAKQPRKRTNPLEDIATSVTQAKDNFITSRDYSSAAKFNALYQDIVGVHKTVLSFRKQIAELAQTRDNSINDYYYALSEYTKRLSSNTQNLNNEEEIYDTKNAFMIKGFESDFNGFRAEQINIFSPDRIIAPFAKFAKIIDKPMTLNNVQVSNDGRISADSMVIYEFDEIDKMWSAKTYLKPLIRYVNKSKDDVVFRIDAKAAFDTAFDASEYNKTTYFKNMFEEYSESDVEVFSDHVLGRKNSGVSVYYLNYNEYLGKIGCDKKHILDLKDI